MKKLAKALIVGILNMQVRRLQRKNSFKIVAVTGSIGKTSTKLAIATVLKTKYRVQYQEGNYNDVVTVPLIFFGQPEPSLFNPLAWLKTLVDNERQLRQPYPYEVVVVELATDYPGNIIKFSKCLKPDIAVITALTAEHMEFFSSLDAVAKEELSVAGFSKKILVNSDLCDDKYLEKYSVQAQKYSGGTETEQDSDAQCHSAAAAKAVAGLLGLTTDEIDQGVRQITAFAGRMQRLRGIQNSIILDDSYNASPAAAKLALDTLYKTSATQRIALLGNMNEMGSYSPEAHKEVGLYCDPSKLDLVVTLGPDANKFLAQAAESKGCKVVTTSSPYESAAAIETALKPDAVILVKGSQNGVFAEEAIKLLLDDPSDASKLVRQSPNWLKIKEKQFGKLPKKG